MSGIYDLIVVGAGPGGYEAAAHAAQLGKRVALVERGRTGGACLNVGCIPTKAFLRSSRLFADCRNAQAYGVRIDGLSFDLPAVIARKNRIVGTLRRGVESMLKRAGVEVIRAHGRLASRRTVAADGRVLEARNILIATGSRPAAPPVPGIESALDSDAILDRPEIPHSLAIIGGGYIGLEFAGFFSAIGTEVTVFEMLPQVAPGVDRDIAARLVDSLEKSGVTVRTSCRVTAVNGETVHYQDEAGKAQALRVACVLNAAGRVPVTDGLGLEEIGVDFDQRGIRTSEEGRTSAPNVWACGDVTGRRLLAHAATREGVVAVNNMFGRRDRIRYHAIPSVIYTHPEIASVGCTEEELQAQGVAYRRALVPMSISGRFLVENEGATGAIKVLAGARHGEILGVHAAGDGASEFIALAATLLETEMCAADAAGIVFPHPTVCEALKSAILQVL
ncbi:MAG TPA: dihydrolipoyl dehydrogenase [Bryobacteraceae bacterium]|nr:dihydrolipoyl dehydrogenase [Bryobacteraceae bacterium]